MTKTTRRKLEWAGVILLSAQLLAACQVTDADKENETDNDTPEQETGSDNIQTSPFHPEEKNWRLVWSDEFDGNSIDPAKWSFEENCWGGGNNEQQCYTGRPVNAFVEDGVLEIRARREDFTGPVENQDSPNYDPNNTRTLPYTSARLRTLNKGDWKYGRFEIRARLPEGQGSWPAIWMLPTDWVYGGWAASGEIDIMEAVNLKTQSDADGAELGDQESRVHGTLHYGRAWPDNAYSGTAYDLGDNNNPADGFHHYALEWQEGEIRWYVDGVHYATQTEDDWYSQYQESGEWVTGEGAAPFNQKFHMILNLAVGGNWAAGVNEGGVDESAFPQSMLVDFVRVYQCDVDAVTGAGCETRSPMAEDVEGHDAPVVDTPDDGFGDGPVFHIYQDELTEGLAWQTYNPSGAIATTEVTEGDNRYLNIIKSGGDGNAYANSAARLDLSHWGENGDMVFDIRVNSIGENVSLLVKVDSGWPQVSDVSIDIPATSVWNEVRINIAELVVNGNSIQNGQADLSDVLNVVVFEPSGEINFDVDNIRYEKVPD